MYVVWLIHGQPLTFMINDLSAQNLLIFKVSGEMCKRNYERYLGTSSVIAIMCLNSRSITFYEVFSQLLMYHCSIFLPIKPTCTEHFPWVLSQIGTIHEVI